MGRIIGIDLGTCYSAVAIPEERTGEGFSNLRECQGYSIIQDRFKRGITPSVVAEDDQGNVLVGYPAKARAGFVPEPIMFAKRWMGEDKTFPLAKQGVLRPEEVSAHVLRHLKKMAEDRLGEPVDEAVITVPAYFILRARQMTEKAAELAGLKVAQIAQEPVAAALMYCAGDNRDPLRLMTYDLGGGTFDVAILEKRDGVISTNSIRAFDGDRFLGGYNFDQKLAFWLMDQLNGQGYDLQLDINVNPADRVLFAKLMIYAERAKIELSKSDICEIQEPSTGITDHSGNPVSIQLSVTRDQFESMIATEVEYTLGICHRAMEEKASPPVKIDELDEILMVGGSSRIPLISRRLEQEFGKKPKLVSPDLCVALGAAIIAGTKPKSFGCLKLDPIPAETDLPTLTVTGQVAPGDGLGSVAGCKVTLRNTDGSYRNTRTTEAAGKFLFDGVTLAPEEKTDFVLSVASPSGVEIAAHKFSVLQTASAKAGGLVEAVTNVLSKPIAIQLVDHIEVIAPERTPLPYEKLIKRSTSDTSGVIRVPILEENNPLGEILMKDVPTTLPVGSAIEITITVQENYQILGRAYVPALAREVTVTVDMPVRPQKSMEELRRSFEILAARADEVLRGAGPGALFGDARVKRLKERLKEVETMMQSRAQDTAAIQDRLDEIESLVRDIGAGWKPEPPRAVFEQQAGETADLLSEVVKKKPEVAKDGYDKQLEAIRTEADKAYTAQNTAAWKDSSTKLAKLYERLEKLIKEDGPPPPPPPPGQILIMLAQQLSLLERHAKDSGHYPSLEGKFKEAADSLKRINPDAPDAQLKIHDWYFTKFEELRQALNAPKPQDPGLPK